jgi:hypothetical protein
MQPPQDVYALVDAVLEAEGLDPSVSDRRRRLELCELVEEWLFDEGLGKGTKSGLPSWTSDDSTSARADANRAGVRVIGRRP